jgi:biopolymer transport protein ExbD
MSTGNSKGGVQSDINVTPLIDVLLVLLIIFMVVMPIMMKMETIEVPRKLNQETEVIDPSTQQLTITVEQDLSLVFNDGDKDTRIQAADLLSVLRPRLENVKSGTDRVVFVDFQDGVPWGSVVSTMDTIRSLATDENHDEVKVALKIHDATGSGSAVTP